MEQAKIERINELARLKKQRGLTPEEQEEQTTLRQEYLADWRAGTVAVLENTYVLTPDGKKRKLKELKKK